MLQYTAPKGMKHLNMIRGHRCQRISFFARALSDICPTDKKLFLPAANPRQGESLAGGLGDIRMAGIYPQSFGNTMNEGTILPAEHGVAVPCFLAAGGITGPADPQKGCRFPNYPLPGPYR